MCSFIVIIIIIIYYVVMQWELCPVEESTGMWSIVLIFRISVILFKKRKTKRGFFFFGWKTKREND